MRCLGPVPAIWEHPKSKPTTQTGDGSDLHLTRSTFRPRKKIFSPPRPKESPIRRRHPLAPPRENPPPPYLGFSIKNRSLPPPAVSDSPFLPRPEKNKKYPKRPPSLSRGTVWLVFQVHLALRWQHFLRTILFLQPSESCRLAEKYEGNKYYFACSPEEFCEYFFRVCLGILHWKMAGISGEFFLVSVSHETKREKSSKNSGKIRSKIRGKIRDEISKNSGNFRSATFLT